MNEFLCIPTKVQVNERVETYHQQNSFTEKVNHPLNEHNLAEKIGDLLVFNDEISH